MISNISYKLLYLSLSILMAGTLGGWAIVSKLSGQDAASEFFYFGLAIVAIVFFAQCAVYFLMKERLFFKLIFLALFGLSLVWFMGVLVIPLFWLSVVGLEIKLAMVLLFIILCICNLIESFKIFDVKWRGMEDGVRVRKLERTDNQVNWDKLVASMRFSPDIYIPGLSRRASTVLAVIMVLFMLVGLNLRTLFPVFSMFSVGIPSAIVVSFFFQIIGFNLAQARQVRLLEQEYKIVLCQKSQVAT